MNTAKVNRYKVIIEQGQDGYFIARVPAVPGCFTQAKTYEEVIARVKEAIQLCQEVAEEDADYRQKSSLFGSEPPFIGLADVAV